MPGRSVGPASTCGETGPGRARGHAKGQPCTTCGEAIGAATATPGLLDCSWYHRMHNAGAVRLLFGGKLLPGGTDQRLLMKINDYQNTYFSIVSQNGYYDHTNPISYTESQVDDAANPSNNGIYLGRNGWQNDAYFAIDLKLTILATEGKIITSGLSTFTQSTSVILGYELHGSLDAGQAFTWQNPVSKVSFFTLGGSFSVVDTANAPFS
jgi:hypothetical protein